MSALIQIMLRQLVYISLEKIFINCKLFFEPLYLFEHLNDQKNLINLISSESHYRVK